jgi:hypothetical protein
MDLSFTIADGPRQRIILRSESRGNHDHNLLSQFRGFPNMEGQVPVFISPRNRVARLYPQVLGSLFVASYVSQGYGGGTQPRLHTGSELVNLTVFKITPRRGPHRKHSSSIVACSFISAGSFLLSRCSEAALSLFACCIATVVVAVCIEVLA